MFFGIIYCMHIQKHLYGFHKGVFTFENAVLFIVCLKNSYLIISVPITVQPISNSFDLLLQPAI